MPEQFARPPAGTAAGAREFSGLDEALLAILFAHLAVLRVADAGKAVLIALWVRRFRRLRPECPAVTSRA